ncbi:MAG: hypothetical protein H6741_15210 [Alphaproteobacteria bacterium]|nr:hypothetical protein [Alphaproteobacteria bacterium]
MSRSLPLLLALVALPALAQEATDGAPVESKAPSLSDARGALTEIREHRDHVTQLHDKAKGGDDAELSTCLASRVTQLNTLSEVSEGILADMTSALGEGEDGRAAAEGRKLTIAATKARSLRAEAEACGQEGGVTEAPVVVEDPYGDEEEQVDVENQGVGNDPPGASPFE